MKTPTPSKSCKLAGCDNRLRAKGLCSTHYNQQQPNRHRKTSTQCSGCGESIVTYNGADRWGRTFCSELCRTWTVWQSSPCSTIPREHPARWFGATCVWEAPLVRNTGECAWCAGPNLRHRSSLYCSPTCKMNAKRIRRRGRLHKADGVYTYGQLVQLWAAFDMSCAYCRRPLALPNVQAEHVVPLSRGGHNGLGNILPSCLACNADKRDLLLAEWAMDRTERNLPPRVTTWSGTDPSYAHLSSTTAA